jgi:hypothetical protein
MLYDAFIAHASEDKANFVRPLANKLKQFHLEIWYDEFSLSVGDSLRESIDKGLAKSRYGIVVLSPSFFKKKWPQRELNGLVAREMSGGVSVILPIWHNITAKEILKYSPPLADRKAIVSAKGLDIVCRELLKKLRPQESPLIIARDILIKNGMTPPVVTDEWWLDVVEASNRVPNGGFVIPEASCWGRWTFPLIGYGYRGKERGEWLAWTAMQMRWEEEADKKRITQITKPKEVLKFINSMPGLEYICHTYPLILANYAPQLTIKGLSGEFEEDFDYILKKSVQNQNRERKNKSSSGIALTTNHLPPACDREIALRHPSFGDYGSPYVACQFVQGELGGPQIKYYEIFEYLVWFLSSDSAWIPDKIHNFLIDGMKKWAVWLSIGDIYWNMAQDFFHRIIDVKDHRRFKLTSNDRTALLQCISHALKVLKLKDDPALIMNRFLQERIIEAYFVHNKRRTKKKK